MAPWDLKRRRDFARAFATATDEVLVNSFQVSFAEFLERMKELEKVHLLSAAEDAEASQMVRRNVARIIFFQTIARKGEVSFEECVNRYDKLFELGFPDRHFEWQAVSTFAGHCCQSARYPEGLRAIQNLLAGPALAHHELVDIQNVLRHLQKAASQ
jgi:hypothetical protein